MKDFLKKNKPQEMVGPEGLQIPKIKSKTKPPLDLWTTREKPANIHEEKKGNKDG